MLSSKQKEEATRLRAQGASLKEAGTVHRFRVINRLGVPVLQVATTPRDKYSDYVPVAPPAEAAGEQSVEAAASTGGKGAHQQAARAPSPPKPGASLSRGGNAHLATPHHQTEAGRREDGGRREASRASASRDRQRLSPSALHHTGGERQKAVSGLQAGNSTVNSGAAGGTATSKLMAIAGYQPPDTPQQSGYLGARSKAPANGHTHNRH